MNRDRRRSTLARVGAAVAAGTLLFLWATAAWAAGTSAGTALIKDGSSHNVNSGGAQTTWTVALPSGAACTKDTADNNYVVTSYLVDATRNPNPSQLSFQPSGVPNSAAGGTAFPLYETNRQPWIDKATSPITGQVVGITAYNFNRFTLNTPVPRGKFLLPTGTYHIGIACVKPDGSEDKFWDRQVVFTANSGDPNGEVWQTEPSPHSSKSPLAIAVPVSAAVLLVAGGYEVIHRRRQPTAQ